MNFVSHDLGRSIENVNAVLTKDEAHIWRSKIVDKCAEAERHVLRLLQAAGGSVSPKAPLSQKMEALSIAIAESPGKIRGKKVLPLLERLKPVSELRSELAHSTLTIAEVEGEVVAVLWNAAESQPATGFRTLLPLSRLKGCHAELSHIVNSLSQES